MLSAVFATVNPVGRRHQEPNLCRCCIYVATATGVMLPLLNPGAGAATRLLSLPPGTGTYLLPLPPGASVDLRFPPLPSAEDVRTTISLLPPGTICAAAS